MSTILESGAALVTLNASHIRALRAVAACARKRSTKPILTTVMLTLSYDKLTVTASDLDLYVERDLSLYVEIESGLEFSSCVSADLIKKLKAPKAGDAIKLLVTPEYVDIDGLKEFTADAREFPAMPHVDADAHAVDPAYFDGLLAAAPGAATSETRPTLTAVCHQNGQLLATDSHRMLRVDGVPHFERDVLVPAAYAKTLHRLFAGHSASVSADTAWIHYATDDTRVWVRQVQGKYPDMSRILPPHSSFVYSCFIGDVAPWIDAHEGALRVVKARPGKAGKDDDPNNLVRLSLSTSGATLSARHADRGASFSTELPQTPVRGDGITLAYNAAFMLDALRQVGDGATFNFTGTATAFTLLSADRKRLALILPLKVVTS